MKEFWKSFGRIT